MCNVTKKYHVHEYMKFSYEIKSATWDDAAGKWKLVVKHAGQTFQDECDVFINAGGVLKRVSRIIGVELVLTVAK